MLRLAEIMSHSASLYCGASIINNLLLVACCVIGTAAFFKLMPRNKHILFILAAVIAAADGVLHAMLYKNESVVFFKIVSSIDLIYPYVCMLILFPIKKAWKPLLAAFGISNIPELLKYLILMLFFTSYDMYNPDIYLEMILDIVINLAAFVLLLGFFLGYARKRQTDLAITKINIPLYILIVLTSACFIFTMLAFGMNSSNENRTLFFITLANIPLFTVTVFYAVRTVLRSKLAEESYRQIMDMQIKNYELMEKKNEELKIFRHDFPKKLRPLKLYLEDGRSGEAAKMLEDFSVEVEKSRPRYSTGNFCLDTVLECQQQIAEKDNIKIVFPFDSAFPAEGIASEDIYTIFPNALDNAIEACRKLGGGEIRVTSRIAGQNVYVSVKNPFDGNISSRNNNLETIKEDKIRHGYGFKSIKKAAAKYGSENISFSAENGMFTLNIVFELELKLSRSEDNSLEP